MSSTVTESSGPNRASVISNIPSSARKAHREVRFGAYVLGSTLGEGEFGKVKLGWRKDGKHPSQVAIKLIRRDSIMKESESEIKIYREINSLRLLNHPNIVNLVEVLKSGKYIGIVLEYASGGELFDYILKHKYLKENVAKKLFAQLVSGVDYMHSKGLIHRDLKLENLLLDKHKNIIISDFGFVNSYNKAKNDLMKTSCGSPCYAAPELVLTQSPYAGRKVDIWSIGVILYAMLSGYLPFDDDAENEDGADIVRLYNYICNNALTFPEYVSPLARDLLRKIIVPDPAKRIGMDEIRNHPWLAPHANLLSIRQQEWDKISSEEASKLETAKLLNSAAPKRYSMFNEPTSSSALMMNPSKNLHGRSYTSNANIIYANPTTSSSFANVVALPGDNNLNHSASSVATSASSTFSSNMKAQEDRHTPTKQGQFIFQRGHSKSASTSGSYASASVALKAVVSDHDLSDLTHTPVASPTAREKMTRSSTYTGTISTIVESPTHTEFKIPAQNPPKNMLLTLERLPHAQKKPRPTSYHPSSMSSSLIAINNSPSGLLDYMKIGTHLSVQVPQLLSGSPTKSLYRADSTSSGYENAGDANSPGTQATIPRRSTRRDSVVTPINVNGVLTSDLNSHENKRNSVLSYLEDKMDALELTELQSPSKHFADESKIPEIPPLDTDLRPAHVTPQINQLPTFAVPSESPTTELPRKTSSHLSDALDKINESVIHERGARDTRRSSLIVRRERNKENKETRDAKKKNRFSILSFYSTANGSSNSLVSGLKKPLEASNEANIGTDAHEQGRVSSSGSAANSTYVNGREASAARKVMNFFKRRSIRIG